MAFTDIMETVPQLILVICAMETNDNIPKPLYDFIMDVYINHISSTNISYLSPQRKIQNYLKYWNYV